MKNRFTPKLSLTGFAKCLAILFLFFIANSSQAQTSCDAHFAHYSIHNPDSVHFYPSHTGAASYSWSFGDGTSSTSRYPWHFYSGPGTYSACLTVVDTSGLSCTWCDTVHIGTVPVCNAAFSHYVLNNPDSLHFYPNSSTTGTAYYWNFGDGTTSSLQFPWHFYNHSGTYYVCLTVANTSGVTCNKCDTIVVGSPSTCNASFNHYSIHNPDSLHFYPTGGAGIASYYWNFGDGTNSTLQYPWHFYTSSGTYNVCLTVVDSSGTSCTSCSNVHVGPATTCSAAFSHYSLSASSDSIHFYSTGASISSWYWNFGDNTTSTNHFPWHYYYHPGTYYVCLTVVDSSGATCTSCDTVHVGTTSTCSAVFVHYTIHNLDSIHFYPTGPAGNLYYWSFGDGTSSTIFNPWHTYSTPGTYHACLTVADTSGVTCTWCDTVVYVGPHGTTCNAAFNHYFLTHNPDSLHFYAQGSSIASYSWNFGDGTTSTASNQWHFYTSPGTYYVCLSVVTTSGATCTSCDTVHVGTISTVCNAQFAYYTIHNPDSLHFYPTGTAASSYYWTFGDGSTSTLKYPWHLYTGPGTYYVCLTVADTLGVTCTWCDTVHVAHVSSTCNAQFVHYNLPGVNVDSVHFYPTGPHGTSYYWTFGDGTSANFFNPWHYYSHAGTYIACLTVADSNGTSCTVCDTVTVAASTSCNAHFSFYTIHNADSLHFYPTGSPAASYYWDFGDGTTSNLQYPWHFYNHSGTYYVCLTVAETSGVTCTSCDTVHVGPVSTCSAHFAHYNLNGINIDSVHFYPTGPHLASYYWDFGDGTTSTVFNPWHYYSHPGTYYACLTVADSANVTCTWCDTVHVGHPTTCSAMFSHYTLSNVDSVHFYPLHSGATAYYWNFGDSSTSTLQYPWHFYNSNGTYYVCLTVVDTSGVTCTSCDTVSVGHQGFRVMASHHHANNGTADSVQFFPFGSPAAAYYWDFGDGSFSSENSPWHLYANTGFYYITLTAADSVGAISVAYDTVNTLGTSVPVVATDPAGVVKVYPNPSNDFAIVYVKNISGSPAFRMYDLTGRMIYARGNLNEGSFTINTKDITPGIYYYAVSDESQIISQGKLMVIH